ncbi:MAG: Iron-sulfur cluster assembly scaffold protein IscU 2 [Promethearchaeota archaeon]|nr:MAG: Iron-sulfur cluster assembly scaffold protein IscU 2 [Candidatus Lokiarchaeota archaeon]
MDHFKNPKNMGELDNPSAIGEAGNPVCGDITYIYIKVGEKNGEEFLEDIKFQTFGCAAAIATSSILTELAKGKKLQTASRITREDIAAALDGLPEAKMHCSNLASDGLRDAINKYEAKKKTKVDSF